MALEGIIYKELDIYDPDHPTDGWLPRLTSNVPSFGSAYPNPATRLTSAKNAWVADKAADRWPNYFKGGITSPFPQDQSGKYDPFTAGSGLRDAAFWGMCMSKSTNPTTSAAGKAVMQQVIAEIITGYVDLKYTFAGYPDGIRAMDWKGTPQRWVPGGMSDVNPTFPISEMQIRVAFAYDFAKSEATDAQRAKITAWLYDGAKLVYSWCKKDLDTHFVSRTGEPGTYTLKGQYTVSALTTGQSRAHFGGWIVNKVAAYRNNRRRTMMVNNGLIGLMLDKQDLIEAGIRYYQEHFAYAIAVDQTYADFQRSKDKTSTGLYKAYQGYSYSHPRELLVFAYACKMKGIADNQVVTFSTTKGLTSAQAGQGATSNNSTPKSLESTVLLMNQIYVGTANFYCPADSSKRIGPTDLTGKKNAQHMLEYMPNLIWQNSGRYTFLQANNPPSNVQPIGPAKWYEAGGLPDGPLMYGGYGNVPVRNRFTVEENPEEPGEEKVAVSVNFPDQPDRKFVPDQLITFNATLLKSSDNTATGVAPTVFLADAAGIVVQESQTPGQLVVKVTGANAIFRVGASFAGNDNYLAATTKYNYVKISKADQVIDADLIPDVEVGQTFNVVVSATSGLPVTATPGAGLTAEDADSFTANTEGTSSITYTQAGNSNYNVAEPVVRQVVIKAVPDEGDPEPPVVEIIKDTDDLIPKESLPKNTANGWYQRILGTGGKYYYRFRMFFTPFSSPAVPTGLIIDSGRQGSLKPSAIKNNKIQSYRAYVKETALSEPVLWLQDNQTQSEHIERGIPITDAENGPGLESAYQIYVEFDSQDPYVRIQRIALKGYYLS